MFVTILKDLHTDFFQTVASRMWHAATNDNEETYQDSALRKEVEEDFEKHLSISVITVILGGA